MSWEPMLLTEDVVRGLRIEQDFNSGKIPLPQSFLKVDLSNMLRTPSTNLPAILRLDGKTLRSGLELHPLLTPGPADVAFVLAQKRGQLSTALRELGHWEFPTVILVLQGGLESEQIISHDGCEFMYRSRAGEMQLVIIPPCSDKIIFVQQGSVLLLGSPGHCHGALELDVDDYLEPFRISSVGNNIRPLLAGQNLGGNLVAIHRHRPSEVLEPHNGGLLSFGIHTSSERHIIHAPDVFVVGPHAVVRPKLPRHTLDIALA